MQSPPEAIVRFCKILNGDPSLASTIKAARTPQQILDCAASVGCDITPLELRTWSRELTASYFPWAAKGRSWRLRFFDEQPVPKQP